MAPRTRGPMPTPVDIPCADTLPSPEPTLPAASNDTVFHKLKDFDDGHCRNLHVTKNGEYLVFAKANSDCNDDEMVIHKYSPATNQWNEELAADVVNYKCSAYNPTSNALYVMDGNKIREIDIQRCKITTRFVISRDRENIWRAPSDYMDMFLIGDVLHIFESHGREHFTIDISRRSKWKFIKQYPIHRGWKRDNLVICNLRNSIISFEQKLCRVTGSGFCRLVEESLDNEECHWMKWSTVKRSNDYRGQGMVMTADERYLFCFGGDSTWNGTKKLSQSIIIYDLEREEKRMSTIKCPLMGSYHAVLVGNRDRDMLSVFGFINKAYKKTAFRDVGVLPHYLIELIAKWYQNQQIYLIASEREESEDNHWKINVDDIITSL